MTFCKHCRTAIAKMHSPKNPKDYVWYHIVTGIIYCRNVQAEPEENQADV